MPLDEQTRSDSHRIVTSTESAWNKESLSYADPPQYSEKWVSIYMMEKKSLLSFAKLTSSKDHDQVWGRKRGI